MLRSRTDILGSGRIQASLANEDRPGRLAIAAPVILDYEDYRLIGYHCGENESQSKLGHVKKIEGRGQPLIIYQSHFPRLNRWVIKLRDRRELRGTKESPLDKQLERLATGTPMEVVNFPELGEIRGYIGFFGGYNQGGLVLYNAFDKKAEEYIDLSKVSFLRGLFANLPDNVSLTPPRIPMRGNIEWINLLSAFQTKIII